MWPMLAAAVALGYAAYRALTRPRADYVDAAALGEINRRHDAGVQLEESLGAPTPRKRERERDTGRARSADGAYTRPLRRTS